MTREEASTILYKEWQRFLEDNLDYAGISDAYMMAINTLKQESCGDSISRQAVLDLVVTNHTELNGVNVVMYSPLYKDIKQLPSVTPQSKMGHWIDTGSGQECSECGEIQHGYDNFRFYCAKCGSKNVTGSEG